MRKLVAVEGHLQKGQPVGPGGRGRVAPPRLPGSAIAQLRKPQQIGCYVARSGWSGGNVLVVDCGKSETAPVEYTGESSHPHSARPMLLRLLIIHAIASAVARVHTYWQKQDGLPKDAPRQDDSDLRKMYAPNSPKWRQLPKSFVLEPSSCTAVSGSAVAAYSARYNFGWTKAEATTLTAHQKTQMAIRSFSPQHYYQDPLHRASGSGIGSDLGQMTSEDRAWLISIIKEHNVTTMIDVPCGDVNWQLGAWETDSLTAYIGLDIVPRVDAI